MKIKTIYLLTFISFLNVAKGYDKPNSIAFDPNTKAYFITNNKGKTITRLDSNFNKKEIITGLKSPKDLLFATFGPYKGLLVLDSNQVKVYEADSFKLISAYDVSGAIDLEDGEADKTKSNIFYISDSKAHKIFKVEVGGAPFYIPTFSTLSNIRNAKALLFDSKNRLLCTTDTIGSQIFIINTSTGYKSLLQTTSLDYINSIEEDFEGNFYASNWGDSYVYRLDKDFKNAKSLMVYSKPTGLYFNKMYDVLAIACSNCNKVEFYKLHMVYLEYSDTAKCPGDSFYVNPSIQYKGIDTYNQYNAFYVELSDNNGKFNSPLKIATIYSTSEPNSYKVVLPNNFRFYGNAYKIRVRSTSPSFYSLNEVDVVVPYIPFADFFDKDTLNYCTSNNIIIGKKITNNDTLLCNYLWYKDGKIFTNPKTTYEYKESGNHNFKLQAIPKNEGCISSDSIFLKEYIKIKIPFADTIQICQKTDATIGGDSIINTSIHWIDKISKEDYGTKFSFVEYWKKGNTNRVFTATVKSTIAECTAEKDIFLLYKNLPQYSLFADTLYKICTNSEVVLSPKYVEGDTINTFFEWFPNSHFHNPFYQKAIFKNSLNVDSVFKPVLIFRDTLSNCQDSINCKIENHQIPSKPLLKQRNDKTIAILNYNSKFTYKYVLIKKDNSLTEENLNDSAFEIKNPENSKSFLLKVFNKQLCDSVSDTLFIKKLGNVSRFDNSPFIVFPNPANDFFYIKTSTNSGDLLYLKIFDLEGKLVINTNVLENEKINISNLKVGYYLINITFENKNYNTFLIKK